MSERRRSVGSRCRKGIAALVALVALSLGAPVALTSSGCGLLPQPETDGLRVDDGVAPWLDIGAVSFCIDGRRLLSTVERAGTCRADEQVPAACETDDDCDSPEACVCGQCIVELCEFASDCREGLICAGTPRRCQPRCEADTDCGAFGVCNGGACETACYTQSDCPTGELCLVGRCAAIGCGPSGPNCFDGETCALQAVEGSTAGASTTTSSALAPGTLGEPADLVVYASLTSPELPEGIYRFDSTSSTGRLFESPSTTPLVSTQPGETLANPAAVTHDGRVSLFFEVATGGGSTIGRAISVDGGQTFSAPTTAITPIGWTGSVARAPSATYLEAEGRVLLAYEGGPGLGIAIVTEQADGSFVAASAPTLTPRDFDDCVGATPCAPPGDRSSWVSLTAIGAPHIVAFTSQTGRRLIRLYVEGMGTAGPAETGGSFDVPTSSVGYAVAPFSGLEAPLVFDVSASNPTFGRVQNFAPLEERDPSPVELRDGWWMYYSDGESFRVARNPVR